MRIKALNQQFCFTPTLVGVTCCRVSPQSVKDDPSLPFTSFTFGRLAVVRSVTTQPDPLPEVPSVGMLDGKPSPFHLLTERSEREDWLHPARLAPCHVRLMESRRLD